MNAGQIIYPIIFVFVLYFIYLNLRNNIKYKKENMEVLFRLNEDDKTRQLVSNSIIIFIILLSGAFTVGMVANKNFDLEILFSAVILPVLMIFLYIPLTRRTMISTLGIHKRGALIRWESIKGVNYLKPNEKSQVKVKVLYSLIGKDASTEIVFRKDDPQLEQFKNTLKEYRNNKKKEKKSGK